MSGDFLLYRHPYGNCITNLIIHELKRLGLPYYPIFAYSFAFSYIPNFKRLLGDSISACHSYVDGAEVVDPLYQTYGITLYDEARASDKVLFFEKMNADLRVAEIPCLIDAYYDSSTDYANLYKVKHTKGHGRLVVKMDSELVYYYATDINDPPELFTMNFNDFYDSCEKIIKFKYSNNLHKEKEIRHGELKKIIFNWFNSVNYSKMLSDLRAFSDAVRNASNFEEEIEHQFSRNTIPKSHLFGSLELICRSRGAAVTFFQGYIDEFGNRAYLLPLQYLKDSLKLWKKLKFLLIKYGITLNCNIQKVMADNLHDILILEEKIIVMIRELIDCEINTK